MGVRANQNQVVWQAQADKLRMADSSHAMDQINEVLSRLPTASSLLRRVGGRISQSTALYRRQPVSGWRSGGDGGWEEGVADEELEGGGMGDGVASLAGWETKRRRCLERRRVPWVS